jgi:hypothetical protein
MELMGRASRIHGTDGNCRKILVGVVKRRRPHEGTWVYGSVILTH